MIRSLDVSIDLRAEKALGERMVRVAGDAGRTPVLDRDEHGAGVGAVVRTRAANDGGLGQGKGSRSHEGLGAGMLPKLDEMRVGDQQSVGKGQMVERSRTKPLRHFT